MKSTARFRQTIQTRTSLRRFSHDNVQSSLSWILYKRALTLEQSIAHCMKIFIIRLKSTFLWILSNLMIGYYRKTALWTLFRWVMFIYKPLFGYCWILNCKGLNKSCQLIFLSQHGKWGQYSWWQAYYDPKTTMTTVRSTVIVILIYKSFRDWI